MTKYKPKSQPTWTDVKAKLAVFDRTALLVLLHDLYATHKENQAFLHARLDLGEDLLEPYKKISIAGHGLSAGRACQHSGGGP